MRQRAIEELGKAFAYTKPQRTPMSGRVSSDTERFSHRVAYRQWLRDVKGAARIIAEGNRGFDFWRFYEMCGVPSEDR